jgi:hypothetical protein
MIGILLGAIRAAFSLASLVLLTLACAAESKSMPIVVSLSGSIGTRSKRNFHRPESNCSTPLNSGCRVFTVLQPRRRLQIRARRQSTGSVPQTRRKCSKLSFQESDFFSRHFLKRSKVDISQNLKCFLLLHWARSTKLLRNRCLRRLSAPVPYL